MSKSTKKLMKKYIKNIKMNIKKYEKYTKGKGYVREMERKKQKSFGSTHPGTEAFFVIYNIPVL